MHLASFTTDGIPRIGWKSGATRLVPLDAALASFGSEAWPELAGITDMATLIAAGNAARAALERLAATVAANPSRVRAVDTASVRWLPPVARPGKVLGVAMNNSASDARKISAPNHPMFFLKAATSLLGHGEPLVVRPYYGSLHPEPELGVIIGRRARDLDPHTAMDAVYGYTILNDVTGNAMRAEDRVHYYALYASATNPDELERREQHLSYAARYKGTDGFGPCGPWLVTADEVPDPGRLDVVCRVGGEVIAEDSTAYYTYSVPEVLAFISRFQTLEPGDIVSMGTAFRPSATSRRSLHSADMQRVDGPMEVSITGLGTLTTPIRREDPALPAWRLPARRAD
jgi:2-keto-4-pentenoate hydratase/2-oxohepta-3-ene-1,7-dioic acid hydratase in catechol pathway